MKPLFLPSASPRRQELLKLLAYPFEVVLPKVAEQLKPGENAHQYVERLAREKAQAGRHLVDSSEAIVLGADTIVVVDADILEKPRDEAHFLSMFSKLSGRSHQVMTAVCVDDGVRQLHHVVTTEIRFCHIDTAEAKRYWETGEPQDKAGGYGIQGQAGKYVEYLRGSYFAVVGLPLFETEQLIQRMAKGER